MYFKISKLHSWGKRAYQVRRHNCAVLPQHLVRKEGVFLGIQQNNPTIYF